jgi:hypothetical protein
MSTNRRTPPSEELRALRVRMRVLGRRTRAQHKGTSELGWRPVGRILERWG